MDPVSGDSGCSDWRYPASARELRARKKVDERRDFIARNLPNEVPLKLRVVMGQLLANLAYSISIEPKVCRKECLPEQIERFESLPEFTVDQKRGIQDFGIKENLLASVRVRHCCAQMLKGAGGA